MALRRQLEAELGAFGRKEPVRDLRQHAAAVAELGVRAHRAAMVEVDQNLQALFEDVMRLAVLHVGDEADAAGIMLVGRIVERLGAAASADRDRDWLFRSGRATRRTSLGFWRSSFRSPGGRAPCATVHLRIFRRIKEQRAAAHAQPEGFTRRIFFDPSLSFVSTTLEPLLRRRRSLGLAAQKMVSTTVLFRDHDRNGSPTQAVCAQIFSGLGLGESELPRRHSLTQIAGSR